MKFDHCRYDYAQYNLELLENLNIQFETNFLFYTQIHKVDLLKSVIKTLSYENIAFMH